jgi:hypothetical protein
VLGHELAHVVQQASGRAGTRAQRFGGINDDPELEREADEMGQTAAQGGAVAAQSRQEPDEPLARRLERVMGGASEEPVQRMVEMPPDSDRPSFHEYLTKTGNVYYYDKLDRTKGELSLEIFTSLFNSPRIFKLKGDNGKKAEFHLMRHMEARREVIDFALQREYAFEGGYKDFRMNAKYWWWDENEGTFGLLEGVDKQEARDDLNVHPEEYAIGCAAAAKVTMEGGGKSPQVYGSTDVDQDWVPGESGFIENQNWDGNYPGRMGQNLIYMGGKEYWGHLPGKNHVKPYKKWFDMVQSWNQAAKLLPDRNWPSKGLK